MKRVLFPFLVALLAFSCSQQRYDIIIKGGNLVDGTGSSARVADVGINADTIAFIGDLSGAKANKTIDAKGLTVSPGFINMLSWATESLFVDGTSQANIRQGVTLEVFGEGVSLGPIGEDAKGEVAKRFKRNQGVDIDVDWRTLDEALRSLERRGVSPNIASFVGATTVRIHELGFENRLPTEHELERMKTHVRTAMEEGALGVGASLIYAPANYASTEELAELCKVAGEYGGMYITHMRSEGNDILAAIDETLRIGKEGNLPVEIHHLKLAGRANWTKLDSVIGKIDAAQKSGQRVTANMYTYAAGATGLDASMPTWIQEGGLKQWIANLQNPKLRKKALDEMRKESGWENLMRLAGGPENVLLLGFTSDSLRNFKGKTLAEMAAITGKSAEETAMDLVIADSSRVTCAYFMMSEDNIKKQIALPYVSFGSDASSPATEGIFLKWNQHPRAYGNFARLFAKYVREEKVLSLEEAVRRLTSLPATNIKIKKRGTLAPGYYADIAIFNPDKFQDHSTFPDPHHYSTGMHFVLVNGKVVLENGEHTGAKPGRVVRGPGAKISKSLL